jgi:eukaryotic-like serine/threonine-protein kinase
LPRAGFCANSRTIDLNQKMDSSKFQQIEKIYQAALEMAPNRRREYLIEVCGSDDQLRKEVESLLSFDTPSDELISKTPDMLAAEMFSEMKQTDFKGKEIDQYEIISPIGKGGMGTVYLARDKSLGRKIAFKFLDRRFSQDQDRLQRFILEARTASALNHPNIITIFEVGEIDNHNFIATEFIEGKTLRQIIENEPLELMSVVEIAIQIASALKAAHDAGIIHRDIKPDNIMVRPDGLVKVLDFGVAKLSEQDLDAGISIRIETMQGMIIGTVDYMSPEQAGGEEVDTLTDIFSFGVVLYYLLAGKLPFIGDSPSQIINSILTKEPKSLNTFDENIPVELVKIVKKSLEKEKAKRFQSAKEMLHELQQFKKHLVVSEAISNSNQPNIANNSRTEVIDGTTKIEIQKVETEKHAGNIAVQTKSYLRKSIVFSTLFLLLAAIVIGFWYFFR